MYVNFPCLINRMWLVKLTNLIPPPPLNDAVMQDENNDNPHI